MAKMCILFKNCDECPFEKRFFYREDVNAPDISDKYCYWFEVYEGESPVLLINSNYFPEWCPLREENRDE